MREGNPEIIGTSPISNPDDILSKIGNSLIVSHSVVCGKRHVLSAYFRAKRNIERQTAIGSSFATEFFRHLTGERQVSAAINKSKIKVGEKAVLITHDPSLLEKLGLEPDESALECECRKLGLPEDSGDCEDRALERSALVEIS